MQAWLIKKLGGYPTIEDALEACPQKTLDAAVARLFCVVSKDELLREDKGAIWYKGRTLNEQEIQSIREEAKVLLQMPLFKILMTEIKHKAMKRIYYDSQTVNDLTWGKVLLFLEDALTKRLTALSKK